MVKLANKNVRGKLATLFSPSPKNLLKVAPVFGLLVLVATAVFACQSPPPETPTPLPPVPTALSQVQTTPTPAPTNTTASYPIETTTPASYPMPATAYPALETAVFTPPANSQQAYLPFLGNPITPSSTAVLLPPETPSPTPFPTIDFAAVQTELQASNLDLAYVKMGFHVGIGGRSEGLDVWMQRLDEAGVPFFLKTADNAQPVYIAQQLMQTSGVPHTLVYRNAASGDEYDVPNYSLPPEQAALEHWQRHVAAWPPELDPTLVWMETVNEVDRNQAEWLAQFSLATAQLALQSGRKWAAFGWASGEPEPGHWQSLAMLEFLRLVGEHPDQLAIALHEYSYLVEDIGDGYPYKIGRFLELFRICDQYGIPRPTVLITEWGWTYNHVPAPEKALQDIAWASHLYAQYPQVKGAAIWFLGGGFDEIAHETEQLIWPLTVYSLTNYFSVPPASQPVAPDPELFRP